MHTPPLPHKDFDDYNTSKLRQLETDLLVAQQKQAAAQAVSDALSTRYAAFQKSLANAQANSATAADNLAAAQTTTQTVAHAVPFATEAYTQAVLISAKLSPVIEKAHSVALKMIDALNAIDGLVLQVQRRQGKDELISALVVSGANQAHADGLAALTVVTTALQNTILAVASAQEASTAAEKTIDASQRLATLVAPTHAGFDPEHPANGHVWDPADPAPESIRDLARATRRLQLSILAVLDALARIATNATMEQQSATTQTALELNAANDRLNRTTAAAQSAAAALAAAEAAVA